MEKKEHYETMSPIFKELRKRMLPQIKSLQRQLSLLESWLNCPPLEENPTRLARICKLFEDVFPLKISSKVLDSKFKEEMVSAVSSLNNSDSDK